MVTGWDLDTGVPVGAAREACKWLETRRDRGSSGGTSIAQARCEMPTLSLRTLSLLAALAVVFASGPAAAQECAREIDDSGRLVETLRELLGTEGRSLRAALSGIVDEQRLAAEADALSARERTRLAGELLTILGDPRYASARACEEKRVRYNAAALLVQLVKRAPKAERGKLFDCLLEAARRERDSDLRRQLLRDVDRNLDAASSPSAKKAAADALEEILPTRPNYAALFGKDGERTDVHVRMRTAAEVFRGSSYIGMFRRAGAEVDRHGPYDVTIRYTVTPDDPTGKLKPVTYHIRMADEFQDDWENFDIFDAMDDASTQIEVYDFHSQYGNGLDGSFAKAPRASKAEKLYLLIACKSKVFATKAQALYPKTHFVTTTDGEYFVDSPLFLKQMLDDVANRATYRQMQRHLRAEELTNYQMPDERVQLEYLDSDGDGISDAHDEKLDCGLKPTGNAKTFSPRAPKLDDPNALDGRKLLRAVTVANGLLGYNLDVGPRWEDDFVSQGWAPADLDGPVAVITPTKDRRGKNLYEVRVNSAYSHLDDTALAASLTYELTRYAGANGKPERATREARIRAYETAVDLLSAWDPDGEYYDAYQEKYNDFGKEIPWSRAVKALDKNDGATAETIAKIGRLLDRGR